MSPKPDPISSHGSIILGLVNNPSMTARQQHLLGVYYALAAIVLGFGLLALRGRVLVAKIMRAGDFIVFNILFLAIMVLVSCNQFKQMSYI